MADSQAGKLLIPTRAEAVNIARMQFMSQTHTFLMFYNEEFHLIAMEKVYINRPVSINPV